MNVELLCFNFREREHVSEREGQRKREGDNPKQAPCCQRRAQRRAQSYKL